MSAIIIPASMPRRLKGLFVRALATLGWPPIRRLDIAARLHHRHSVRSRRRLRSRR